MSKVTSIVLLLGFIMFNHISLESMSYTGDKTVNQVKLTEVWRIDDGQGEGKFHFRSPRMLKVAPDGSVFVMDRDLLAQFDSDGKYQRNLFKKGKGPGEATFVSGYYPGGKQISIFSSYPDKILRFDMTGNFLGEFRINTGGNRTLFHGVIGDKYLFTTWNQPKDAEDRTFVDIPYKLVSVSDNGQTVNELGQFPVKTYIIMRGRSGMRAIPFQVVPMPNNLIYLSHTPQYQIKQFDMIKKQVIREFNRSYQRVKWPPNPEEDKKYLIGNGKDFYARPRMPYFADLMNLFPCESNLWVATSTVSKEMGYQFDIYSLKGDLINSVYLNVFHELGELKEHPEYMMAGIRQLVIFNNYLYLIAKDQDDQSQIVKYKISF